MLRLLIWGETPRERELAQDNLRLHAQLIDLQEKLHQTQQDAFRDLQQAHNGFLTFLRPMTSPGGSQAAQEPQRDLPGDRPSTTPPYVAPPWADKEVEIATPA